MKETVLIVGGTSGMGLAAALHLSAGYAVVLTGRSPETVAKALALVPGARGLTLDFTHQDSTDEAFASLDTLDHLVLAGSGPPCRGPMQGLSLPRVQEALDQKFFGYLRCAQAALPRLSPRGSLVVVTGGAGRAAIPGTSAMAAINAGLQAWALVLAKEWAPRRVNVLSPGFVDTPLHDWMDPGTKAQTFARLAEGIPVGRIGTADEVAQAVGFLVGNGYVSGAVLDVDGGGRLR